MGVVDLNPTFRLCGLAFVPTRSDKQEEINRKLQKSIRLFHKIHGQFLHSYRSRSWASILL